VIDQLLLV